jgi:outer membrane protein assembly factor BamD
MIMCTEKNKYSNILRFILVFFIISMFVPACSSDKNAVKPESDFEADKSIEKADEMIAGGYYDNAREILEEIRIKDTSQQYDKIAKLRIADTYFEEELYDEAAAEYENFLNVHSYHKYAPYAQFRLAMSYFRRIKTVDVSYSSARKALDEFKKLQTKFPRNPFMDVTESRIKMCRRILAEYEYYVGNFYFEKGSFEAAISRFNGLLKKYPESGKVSAVLYYLGLSYENLGQRDKALSSLNQLIERFPTVELSTEARKTIASFNKSK